MSGFKDPRQPYLVTGASGFLGWHLAGALAQRRPVVGTYHHHALWPSGVVGQPLDVRDGQAVEELIAQLRPAVIFHAAALAQPEACEANPALAEAINVEGTAHVARAAARVGARLIYLSTDLVFDGERGGYRETDPPAPLHCYGRTKARGEELTAGSGAPYLIVRLALLFGPGNGVHGSFSDWLLSRLAAGEPAPLLVDEYRTPLYVGDAVEALARLAAGDFSSEIFHLAGGERVTRYELGKVVAEVFGYDPARLQPVRIAEFQARAKRARDCSLDITKLTQALGWRPHTLRAAGEALRRLAP